MSENKNSSKINEFDFEDDPVKGKVVDQTMVGSGKIPNKNSLITIAVAVILMIGGIKMLSRPGAPKTATPTVKAPSAPLPPKAPPSAAALSPVTVPPPVKAPAQEDTSGRHVVAEPKSQQTAAANTDISSKEIQALMEKLSKQQSMMIEALATKLDDVVQGQKNSFSALQAHAKQLQDAFDNMNGQQKELKGQIDALNVRLDDNTQKIVHVDTLITKQAAEFDVAEDLKAAKPIPKLSVHAAIQGRAWLRDQNNKIFSVVEGDDIPGYGKVLTIDPRLGTVVTNSGSILRY